MKATVVLLKRNEMIEDFVGAVAGKLTKKQKRQLAKDLNLQGTEEEADELQFCVVDVHESVDDLRHFSNASTNGYINAEGEERI